MGLLYYESMLNKHRIENRTFNDGLPCSNDSTFVVYYNVLDTYDADGPLAQVINPTDGTAVDGILVQKFSHTSDVELNFVEWRSRLKVLRKKNKRGESKKNTGTCPGGLAHLPLFLLGRSQRVGWTHIHRCCIHIYGIYLLMYTKRNT